MWESSAGWAIGTTSMVSRSGSTAGTSAIRPMRMPRGGVPPGQVNLFMARNRVAGSKQGLEIWTHKTEPIHDGLSVVDDLTIWNIEQVHYAVQVHYSKNIIFRNLQLFGPGVHGTVAF